MPMTAQPPVDTPQLSLLEQELMPANPQSALVAARAARRDLQGVALELAMRQVFKGWARWHRCKRYEEAVTDPITRRLLELTANRRP